MKIYKNKSCRATEAPPSQLPLRHKGRSCPPTFTNAPKGFIIIRLLSDTASWGFDHEHKFAGTALLPLTRPSNNQSFVQIIPLITKQTRNPEANALLWVVPHVFYTMVQGRC